MAAITKYKKRTGRHWDSKIGANIQGDANKQVWDTYTSKNHLVRPLPNHSSQHRLNHLQQMKPFSNTGWEFYALMIDINPSSEARGDFAFSPMMGISTSSSNAPSFDVPSLDDPSLGNSLLLEQNLAEFNMGDQDDVASVTIIDKGSSTLISTPPVKRKAVAQSESELPSTSTRTGSNSAPPTSSAASHVGSSKRRKGSRPQESTSNLNDVRFQQMVSTHDHLTSSLLEGFKMVNTDPLAEEQKAANAIVRNDTTNFTLREKVSLLKAFSKNPRLVTGFLGCGEDLELRKAFADDILSDMSGV